ncbi:MAG: TraR/DksA family transcriptional regulator [Bacteroidales bacterium]|nr:TraR/DksA family transcriptional regulator [Bacteroidales bacterium]
MEKNTKTTETTKKSRYSDEELQEFKEIILIKLEKATRDLKLLTEAFTNSDSADISDTSPTFKILEEGYQVLSKEENSRLAARQQKFITNLENALIRIENKSYGVCRVTGKLIPKERLRSVPHATLSIDAKLKQV